MIFKEGVKPRGGWILADCTAAGRPDGHSVIILERAWSFKPYGMAAMHERHFLH